MSNVVKRYTSTINVVSPLDATGFGGTSAALTIRGALVVLKNLFQTGASYTSTTVQANGNTVTGLPDPVASTDIVTKMYQDLNGIPGTIKLQSAVGDGTTDDTFAFNFTIGQAATLGLIVIVPPTAAGYLIVGTINLVTGVTIRGYAVDNTQSPSGLGTRLIVRNKDNTGGSGGSTIQMAANSTIDHIEFTYSDMLPNANRGLLASKYGPTIDIQGDGCTVRNVNCHLSQNFIKCNASNVRIMNVSGYPYQPFRLGSTAFISNVVLHTVNMSPSAVSTTLSGSMLSVTTSAITAGGVDGLSVTNAYFKGYANCSFVQSSGYGQSISVLASTFDTMRFILGDGCFGNRGMMMQGCTIIQPSGTAAFSISDGSAGQTSSGETPRLLLRGLTVKNNGTAAPVFDVTNNTSTIQVDWLGGSIAGVGTTIIQYDVANTVPVFRLSGVYGSEGIAGPTGNNETVGNAVQTMTVQSDGTFLFTQNLNATTGTPGAFKTLGGFSAAKTAYVGNKLSCGTAALTTTPSASSGLVFSVPAVTVTDTTTAASGTAAVVYSSFFGVPTLAAANTGVTTTVAATVTIAGAVAPGSESITNTYALQVLSGLVQFPTDILIGGLLVTPSVSDVRRQITFPATAPQLSVANVTGATLNGSTGGMFHLAITLTATTNLYADYAIEVTKTASGYTQTQTYIGDETGVAFSVTSGGQLQYTAPSFTGFVSMSFGFRLKTIT